MVSLRAMRDDSGQVVIITALSLVVLMLFLGLAIDVGHARHVKRQLQTAADAAALAGAMEVRVCGGEKNCSAMQAAAQNALTENGFTGATLLTDCGSTPGSSLTLMLNNGPCSVASDPNSGKSNYVEAIVSEPVPTYFARLAGFDSFQVSARGEAARGLGGPCIYAMNKSQPGSLNIVAGLGFRSNCGIVVESNSSSAVTCLVGALMSAPFVHVTGGTEGLLCGLNSPVTTNVPLPSPTDPLAYLPPPPHADDPNCGSGLSGSTYNGSQTQVNLVSLLSNVTFNPGVYCGGISLTGSILANVTFTPGIYILRNGQGTLPGVPGLSIPVLGLTTSGLTITIAALSSISGQGVMFYNEGDAGSFSLTATPPLLGLSNFNLSAPTSGEYGGILFFQAHGVTNTGTFLVSLLQGSSISGGIYMPDALVSYGVGALSTANTYNFLVSDRIQFTAQILSTFGNDYSTLESGSPLNGDASVLVQ